MRAVHTTIYDSKEFWRHRTYLDYLGFLFIRAEFGVQLSGFPGSPGGTQPCLHPGEMTQGGPKEPPAIFLTGVCETMVHSLYAGSITVGAGQGLW